MSNVKDWPIDRHHELPEVAADTVGTYTLDRRSLRIEFSSSRLDKIDEGEPTGTRHVVARIVLSPEGTLDLLNQMEKIKKGLIEAGAISPARTSKSN